MAYVKVKRPEQTVFVYAIPTDTVETIMKRLIEMTQSSVAPENMRLAYNGTFMSPSDTLAQYTTQDGDILHEIRCIDGKWEPLPANQ